MPVQVHPIAYTDQAANQEFVENNNESAFVGVGDDEGPGIGLYPTAGTSQIVVWCWSQTGHPFGESPEPVLRLEFTDTDSAEALFKYLTSLIRYH